MPGLLPKGLIKKDALNEQKEFQEQRRSTEEIPNPKTKGETDTSVSGKLGSRKR